MLKKIFPFLIAIAILSALFYFLSHPTSSPQNNPNTPTPTPIDYPVYDNPDLVFYYGNGCPHCENVESWLKNNNTKGELKINYKEVYYSDSNSDELYTTVEKYCPNLITDGSIGVPIGFNPVDQKCIQGDVPIIEFLSSKVAK